MSTALPSGWARATLGDIGEYHNGRGFKKEEWSTVGRPIIRIQNLTSADKPFHPGDLLLSWAATLEAFLWDGPDAVLNQHIFKVESWVDPQFHYYVLKLALEDLRRQSHGTGMVHITRGKFLASEILLPPVAEQARIAEVLDSQFAILQEARARLAAARSLLADYRAAALLAAFETPHARASLSDLADIQSGITKRRPAELDGLVEMPYIRTANVQALRLDLAEIKTIMATPQQVERHRLQSGDVLILEGGDADKVGRGWIWSGEIEDCLHQNHVFAVRPRDELDSRFLAYYVNSPQARAYFARAAKQTTNLASINKRQLAALPIPVTTRNEQRRIVDVLDGQMAARYRFDAVLASKAPAVDDLQRSVLYRALTGQLTTREPDGETAQTLLSTFAERRATQKRSNKGRAVLVGS
jgi:type I restriction enzyme S subunit